jgi:hypothetical protein
MTFKEYNEFNIDLDDQLWLNSCIEHFSEISEEHTNIQATFRYAFKFYEPKHTDDEYCWRFVKSAYDQNITNVLSVAFREAYFLAISVESGKTFKIENHINDEDDNKLQKKLFNCIPNVKKVKTICYNTECGFTYIQASGYKHTNEYKYIGKEKGYLLLSLNKTFLNIAKKYIGICKIPKTPPKCHIIRDIKNVTDIKIIKEHIDTYLHVDYIHIWGITTEMIEYVTSKNKSIVILSDDYYCDSENTFNKQIIPLYGCKEVFDNMGLDTNLYIRREYEEKIMNIGIHLWYQDKEIMADIYEENDSNCYC